MKVAAVVYSLAHTSWTASTWARHGVGCPPRRASGATFTLWRTYDARIVYARFALPAREGFRQALRQDLTKGWHRARPAACPRYAARRYRYLSASVERVIPVCGVRSKRANSIFAASGNTS